MTQHPHGLSVAQFRARLVAGKSKEVHFVAVRNAWRHIVKKRARQLNEAVERRKQNHKPHVVGDNKVEGGTAEQRLVYAMEVAHREFRLYYSETGTWTKGYGLTNVPNDSYRSDCSWWFTMLRYACGLKGPSLDGGYTGTILTEGTECSERYAETHAGVAVVFGSGNGFHVASSVGDGTQNVYQHGVPEVDTGTFGQFGSGTEVRFRKFSNKPLHKGE